MEDSEFLLKIKAEQVLRLNENKDIYYAEAQEDLGIRPLSFDEGIKLDLSDMI